MVAMSGGVDSAVSAYLLKESGRDCICANMALFGDCCSRGTDGRLRGDEDARAAAELLGLPFRVYDFREDFMLLVLESFINSYRSGETPNPCVTCNQKIKFGNLLTAALEAGCDSVATGHYAGVERSGERFLLKKARDASKDQSYFLFSLTQAQLSRAAFPLGNLTKLEVRDIAVRLGFSNAHRRESQDICFIEDGDYSGFIERSSDFSGSKGFFLDGSGRILGEHGGIHRYTIGQRRGLGVPSAQPLYVVSIDAASNAIVLGSSEALFSRTLTARCINLIPFDEFGGTLRVSARVRSSQTEKTAMARMTDSDELLLEFDEPQRAVTKGQAVVLYDGNYVLGGGTISGSGNLY